MTDDEDFASHLKLVHNSSEGAVLMESADDEADDHWLPSSEATRGVQDYLYHPENKNT